jgi:hypothetical protein
VRGISVDRLVKREERGGVIEGNVESGVRSREGVREAGNEFLEISLALCSGDRGARAVVVIEGLTWLVC